MNEFVDLLPAQRPGDDESWYRWLYRRTRCTRTTSRLRRGLHRGALAGDRYLQIDYALMLADHVNGRPCTVACIGALYLVNSALV
jgi:ADP-glucose pyrophosphorylase